MNELLTQNLFSNVKELIISSRNNIIQTVNTTMVCTYFEIGRLIVRDLQDGKERASYGKKVLKSLSENLTEEFGKGFSVQNLERMRTFYQLYSPKFIDNSISSTLSGISKKSTSEVLSKKFLLSWSHYVFLLRIENSEERK